MEWPLRVFCEPAASLLAETRTRRLHPAQSMAQGLLLRKDMPTNGIFLLVGWAEELERRSQRKHRKTIMLVAMQEIGTVTAPNITYEPSKPLKKKYAHH